MPDGGVQSRRYGGADAPPHSSFDKAAIRHVASYIKAPLLYRHWYVAGTRDEITREPLGRTILDHAIVFYRTEAGEPVALQDRCLHRSFPLSKSRLVGDELVCRYHGMRYARDGSVVKIPCQETRPDRALRRYPLREIGPLVFIWMGDGSPDEAELEAVAWLDDPTYRAVHGGLQIEANYLLMQENLNDFTHFAFLHHDSFGVEEAYAESAPTITQRDGKVFSLRAERNSDVIRGVLTPPRVAASLAGKDLVRYDESHSASPGVFVSRLWTEVDGAAASPGGMQAYILHTLTPVTETRCLYWWTVAFNHGQGEDEYFAHLPEFLARGFREDVAACEEIQKLIFEDNTQNEELTISGDRAGLLFRKMIIDLSRSEYVD